MGQDNIKKDYQLLLKKLIREKLSRLGFIVLIIGIVSFGAYLWFGTKGEEYEVMKELALSLIGSSVSVLLIDILLSNFLREETNRELSDICKSLYDDSDPMLSDFNQKRLENVVKNSLANVAGGPYTDNVLLPIIRRFTRSVGFRSNFNYQVTMRMSSKSFPKATMPIINQKLHYQKHVFTPLDIEYKLVCVFSFGDPFKVDMKADEIAFFCEEIPYPIEELLRQADIECRDDLNWDEAIVKAFRLRLSIGNHTNVNVSTEIIRNNGSISAIKISSPIPDDAWCNSEFEKFRNFKAQIDCCYPTRQNFFYWKFAEPIFKLSKGSATRFSFSFDESYPVNLNDVHWVSYFSETRKDQQNQDMEKESDSNRISFFDRTLEFDSDDTHFPESGIYIHWGKS
jgi:hypothetical protein